MTEDQFRDQFDKLTGNPPFPWQTALYERFVAGDIPASCNLPTGLGKTSVIAVWLIARERFPDKLPRRLVYVVNRRTVVDQTTDEVEKYKKNLTAAGITTDFALSTLRGQFADNREWSADPSRPAVICGTVDMIGSRLLFSGYGVGMKGKPLHAGFLGQDSLIVHDEAHLEPAFQELLLAIEQEQKREREGKPALPWSQLRVMELTATPRSQGDVFPNDDQRKKNEANAEVLRRIGAVKTLSLHQPKSDAKLAEEVADKAKTFEGMDAAVLVFLFRVADVQTVMDKLPKGRKQLLTGTIRGLERDRMANPMTPEGCPIFARFLPPQKDDIPERERWKVKPAEGTVYLVCTSAGEVGVNISADHLVCDLTTFESMAQRFGRVNRFGKRDDTLVHVFHPNAYDAKQEYDTRRQRTKVLLEPLDGKSASPKALGELDLADRIAAFAPEPTTLPATDILFDAWALTTIKEKLPGRPKVELYLHGITDWQPPETQIAWRDEVEKLHVKPWTEWEAKEFTKFAADLLEAYPVKPHELLKEPSHRAFKQFEAMAKRLADKIAPVWLVDDDGKVAVTTLKELADKDNKDRINGMTVLLPPSAGGLSAGMLDGATDTANDVADTAERVRVWSNDEQFDKKTDGMHSVFSVTFSTADEDAEEKTWEWFALRNEGDKAAKKPVLWEIHVKDVVDRTREIVANLTLDEGLKKAISVAADLHDHGKRRKLFQTVLGNTKYPQQVLAKSGKKSGRVKEQYRHEFGSLLDVEKELNGEHRDLILHLIAAHHGRARPHFPPDEAFDPERPHADVERMAAEVPQRFARLQRKYGRWGLAYLESLLRAADWAASANPSKFVEGSQ